MTTEELSPQVGPAEAKHINSRRYQDVITGDRVTTTHWFIAWAGGLGFMIESMGTAVYALIIPQLLDDFDADLETKTVLGVALERTRVSLGLDTFANGIIARRIVELAKAGERNPDLLCEGAIEKLRGHLYGD